MSDSSRVIRKEIVEILSEEANIIIDREQPTDQEHKTLIARPYNRANNDDCQTIKETLKLTRENKTLAVKQLGLTPRQLYYRMKKLNIPL